jgi:hypothetical protein
MKTFLLLSFFFSIIFNFSNAQPIIEWQNTIGGNNEESLQSVIQTTDGGYLLGGYSWSGISGDKTEANQGTWDYWVVKQDGSGNILWQNTIGGNDADQLQSVIQTTDGGYLLGGYSGSDISGDKTEANQGLYDYWVVKLDVTGNIEWQNTIGGYKEDDLHSVIQTTDGGYLLGGYSESGTNGDKTEPSQGFRDYWVVKLDGLGNILWQKAFGGNLNDYLNSVIQTIDGGYLLGGWSQSGISGDKSEANQGYYDYWVVKLDGLGNIQWENSLGGDSEDRLYSVIQTTDGGFLLGGSSQSDLSGDKTEGNQGYYSSDYWVVKLDGSGNIMWQNTIGGNSDDELYSVIQTTDGGYLLGGSSNSPISGDKTEVNQGYESYTTDYWVVKLDGSGNIMWQNTIGGDDYDLLYSVIQTSDGGYLLGGTSSSEISGDKTEASQGYSDYWVVKLTEEYNLITGNLYFDFNNNLIQDAGEPNIPYQKVTEINTGRFAFSEQNGFFSVSVLDTGNYSVTPEGINYYTAVPASHSAYFSGILQTDSLNDFAFQPEGVFNDLQITITPLTGFSPGFDASYNIDYTNVGTTSLAGTVVFYPDANVSYVSSSVTPDQITADSVVWTTATLTPFQSGSILVTVNVSTGAVIGSTITSSSTIFPIVGDAEISNNNSSWEVIVTGSFDPNDILVNIHTIYTTELATPPSLEYIINFQNTGTDTAFNVKVLNPITDKLDFTTFDFVTSSHPVDLSYNAFSQRMEFVFDNILLPDSNINEPESHGFIRYKIKPVTTLSAGDSIINNASIFFDFNAPILTNDAVTEVVLPIPTSNFNLNNFTNSLEIFPNPATETVTIKSQKQIAGEAEWMVYDLVGREVYSAKTKNESSLTIDLSHFAKGLYFIQLHSENDGYLATMVKQ